MGVRCRESIKCGRCDQRIDRLANLLVRLLRGPASVAAGLPQLSAALLRQVAQSCVGVATSFVGPPETMISLGVDDGVHTGDSSAGSAVAANSREQNYKAMTLGGLAEQVSDEIGVETLLRRYFREEPTPDYQCEQCGKRGHARKVTQMIGPPPPALCLHLKRFATIPQPTPPEPPDATAGGSSPVTPNKSSLAKKRPAPSIIMAKSHRHVLAPVVIDLAAEDSNGQPILEMGTGGATCTYELFGIVVHDGGMGGGHYMAYCRRLQGPKPASGAHAGDWHWFSDQFHQPVPDAEVSASRFLCASRVALCM
eukprot:SAG31_NODE_1452_length_8286_cov_6.329547_3_plen_310_part_00